MRPRHCFVIVAPPIIATKRVTLTINGGPLGGSPFDRGVGIIYNNVRRGVAHPPSLAGVAGRQYGETPARRRYLGFI
jgi:hypothetical protein